jgi:hypothetical protein
MKKKKWVVEHRFAWFPALIRNKTKIPMQMGMHWVWFKKYTRVSVWKPFPEPGRYRTYETVLGHVNFPVSNEDV